MTIVLKTSNTASMRLLCVTGPQESGRVARSFVANRRRARYAFDCRFRAPVRLFRPFIPSVYSFRFLLFYFRRAKLFLIFGRKRDDCRRKPA